MAGMPKTSRAVAQARRPVARRRSASDSRVRTASATWSVEASVTMPAPCSATAGARPQLSVRTTGSPWAMASRTLIG